MASYPPPYPPPPPPQLPETLLVKHLPEGMTEEMLSRLFSHYGASSVRPCAGGKLRNCAFVDFKDEATANHAQSQLNRLRFLGKVLIVERACKISKIGQDETTKEISSASIPMQNKTSINQNKLAAGSEPIAPTLGVDYPFPPHLEYQYPPPDGNILTNIVNALIAVPRFYTQVLHLMNKMNIPAPFRMALPTPPLPPPVTAPPPPPPLPPEKPPTADLSSDESEIESSDEDDEGRKRKKVKREVIVGPAVDKTVAHESVGLKPVTVPKERVIKKKAPVLQIKIVSKPVRQGTGEESRDANEKEESTDMKEKEMTAEKQFATAQEIENGKMPPEEILSLPMFKKYMPGNPASVLYIKNLAKDVVSDDFYFIFGSIFGSYEAATSGLSIKLMQEGRMRGQAFVTFPSIELAQCALNLANGYVFKGKPIIIQFGRNPSSNKGS
ncbi:U11/U12 small nuclear ribonucleoprotein [Carex littledalei]|uniref:U11/U12 small nuclear ribonucleoprotein n=1 Tax=Carex littledalei TaxID=544730 RepID=A0A833VFI4_9POAL|nr:U11/U12 small nuclear ribonucleoprotein [Carex littledalei]